MRRSTMMALATIALVVLFTARLYWVSREPILTMKLISEGKACSDIESLRLAEDKYRESHGGCAAPSMEELAVPDTDRGAYFFADAIVERKPQNCVLKYSIVGMPKNPGETGDIYYYLDESGVFRSGKMGPFKPAVIAPAATEPISRGPRDSG